MPETVTVGIIGDFNPRYETHAATNLSLNHSASGLEVEVRGEWVPTLSLVEHVKEKLDQFDALLCAPGSPYKSMEGALNGIRFARENNRPFLGTCGGFQHTIVEYARNVMGLLDAEHAEEHPEAPNLFITPLACSLVGRIEEIRLIAGSQASEIYRRHNAHAMERFYCSYGVNPLRRTELEEAGLRFSGVDVNGEARILELPTAHFFLATLFVPQACSTPTCPHPIITDLILTALSRQ